MNAVEVAVLNLHAGDRQHARLVLLYGKIVCLYRAGANPVLSVYGYYDALRRAYALMHTAYKVKLTGSVDNVDLRVKPHSIRYGSIYRDFSADLLRVEIADGVTVGCIAHSVGKTALKKHCFR